MNLEGKIALVTGASRGLGLAIAKKLGAQGAKVIGTATSEANTKLISQAFNEHNINGHAMVLNVTDMKMVEDVINTIQQEFGAPSILVNNAGITCDNLIMRMKQEEWDKIIDTNLTSIYRLSKACIRGMMKARWGRIINISSVVALSGNPGQCNYAASKAGMIGFTKSLAIELASRNITVNAVAPGFIESDMTNQLDEQQQAALLNMIPAKRIGRPEEIAHAVAFLASEEAGYITGETINVNGGMYMH